MPRKPANTPAENVAAVVADAITTAPKPQRGRPKAAPDAPPGDTYSPTQAGQLLGISARRVSQLAAEGRLVIVQQNPLRLSAQSVNDMRAARLSRAADVRANPVPKDAGQVAEQIERVAQLLAQQSMRALEAEASVVAQVKAERDRLLTDLDDTRRQLAEARAECDRLRAELEQARTVRRRWFG